MKQALYIIAIVFLISSCTGGKRVVEQIYFQTEYKFSSAIANKLQEDTVPWKHQIAASDYASNGDYRNALIEWDIAMPVGDRKLTEVEINAFNEKYSKVKAADYIIQEAKKYQVVIINEAHHNSFHRVFTRSLLQDLFDNGYRNLGIEALENGENLEASLNERKYPLLSSGYYTKDPQFANLIRTALEIGFTLFPYEIKETGISSVESREKAQAKNIQNFIASKPNEKFLIYCGFDHNLEGVHHTWGSTMTSRLTEYTGINPLTINQVVYSERSKPEYNHPLWKAFDIKASTVMIDKDNNPLKYEREEAWSDIAVFHPQTNYVNNRPNWIFENGNKNVSISLVDIQLEFPLMVLAFKKGEPFHEAVPYDITEVVHETRSCNLGLEKGVYEVVVTNGDKSIKFEKRVR